MAYANGRKPHKRKLDALETEFRVLAANGATIQKIARELDVSLNMAAMFAKAQMITVQHANEVLIDKPRTAAMVSMYRQGLTLATIGEKYFVSRERVRQILSKAGITAEDGGQHVQSEAKLAAKRQRALDRIARNWGATSIEQYTDWVAAGLTKVYGRQRQAAKMRAIGWRLNLPQWLAIWYASGKLHLRGRGVGKYCLSRIKDAGPYEVGNCHVQLCTENSSDGFAKARGKSKPFVGVFLLYPGRERAWQAKVGRTRLGYFTSAEEANAARQAHLAAIAA